jgi:hypothetical protein
LEAERKELLKQVKDTTLTVQKVSDVVDIPGNVWWKAKMFDAEECGPHFRDEDDYLRHAWINETLDGCHVAKVTPPSSTMAFGKLKYVSVERRAESGERILESKKCRLCWVILGEAVPISVEVEIV